MNVYKYRTDLEFVRDLNAIERNVFWASNAEQLNDPTETLVLSDNFKNFINTLSSNRDQAVQDASANVYSALDQVLARSNKIGIYSLSQTYNDELLWAHYSNSHKGFSIEYDLDLLLKTNKVDNVYSFPIEYTQQPPEIDLTDLNTLSNRNGISIVKKLAGHKSMRWAYEKEYRIVVDSWGEYVYNYEALKGIYFGLRMKDSHKSDIMNRLKGRGIKYYQITQIKNTYLFEKDSVKDITGDALIYLNQLPISDKRQNPIGFKILEKDFNRFFGSAELTIQLASKIDQDDLRDILGLIKENLYSNAQRILILCFVKEPANDGLPWATINYSKEKIDININTK